MKIGVIGLGKLGAPYAGTLQDVGHQVLPFDLFAPGVWVSPERLVTECHLTLVIVPTPHDSEFSGETRLPPTRADFDVSAVVETLDRLRSAAHDAPPVAVVSTVLPGSYDRVLHRHAAGLRYAYSPCFAAMGSVEDDLRAPEFNLIGTPGARRCLELEEMYRSLNDAETITTDVTTAEGIKVLYNSFIGAKVALGNLWGEMAEKLGMNVDTIHHAMSLSTKRLLSPRYLAAGMPDGGPCHPRDNIALSWLARELGLSFDLFGALMEAREAHAEWLASMTPDGAVLFGRVFKPGTKLTDGSGALLLASILTEQGKTFIHAEMPTPGMFNVICVRDPSYNGVPWPEGSTVLDPFGIIRDTPGVTIKRIGRP